MDLISQSKGGIAIGNATGVRRYFIYLAYNGKNYCGWQSQPNGCAVQQTVEEAFFTLLRETVPIVGAGRTDAGVHARLMVAHFDWKEPIEDVVFLADKLNRILPKDIVIYKIVPVISEAHARFDATTRTYTYYITVRKDPFNYEFVYKYGGHLDFELMNEACGVLSDYVDFTSFSKSHTDVKTNNCHIQYACWERKGDVWAFTIRSDRFLRNMVRAIVGTLLEVGRGRMTVDGFRAVIEAKDRCKAGVSVPGNALFLEDITYPERLFEV